MKTILIIEDDNDINNMLYDLLSLNNYRVIRAYSGSEGIIHFENNKNIDLVLLDLMIPGYNGNEVLKIIRKESDVPIIALTALGYKENKIETLQLGANDYITKPFDNDELLVRIEVQLRLIRKIESKDFLQYKNLVLNLNSHEAYLNGKEIIFSKKEFDILVLLINYPNKVFSKSNIYEAVWLEDSIVDENTINVHISRIRSKLSDINPHDDYIQTVWGIGFKMI
jgi:Response regulators consisting of a CheY-like receiver domain and a winged-helix DNA-binding domain